MALLTITERGIYCEQADVYIDPWKPVSRALITHGHSDHARWGHKYYLCTEAAAPMIRHRLGDIFLETLPFGTVRRVRGVDFSFHPAGHIPGSAQVRVAYQGEIWVVSGDYKIENDGLSEPFEPVRCHTFITESTFGLPVYKWQPQAAVMSEVNAWWRANQAAGKVSVLGAYSLGKAQRLLQGLDPGIGPVFTHGAIENANEVLREQGLRLQTTQRLTSETSRAEIAGAMVLAPPSALDSPWIRRLRPLEVAMASGWMSLRGARRRRNADRGFVLSDHADWEGLNTAIQATGAERVLVTHGYTDIFARWLQEQGLDAAPVRTAFVGEQMETDSQDTTGEEQ